MDARNPAAFFSDDFADLFNESDMEIEEFENSQDSLLSLIRLLESEGSMQKRLESVQNLVLKFVPTTSVIDVDKKILRHLMPVIKDLLGDIFKEISQTVPTTDTKEKSVETVNVLQEYLQMCVGILKTLDGILVCVLKNEDIDFCYVQSVPLNMVQILHLTFQHCKDSDKLYKSYLDDLKEILLLFKGAQDIHTKLLKLLERHVNVENLLEEEIALVTHVLEVFGEIGEVLIDMNIKALADNWKGYMVLAEKFAVVLKQSSFSVNRPLVFLSSTISRNLDNVLKMDANDLKGSTQTLKICTFFVRIALKLCDTFWANLDGISSGVLEFLLSIYNFYPPFLKLNGSPEHVLSEVDSLVFHCADPLLDKLLCEATFFQALGNTNIHASNSPSLLFLLTSIFQKLTIVKIDQDIQIDGIINLFFEVVKNSYCEFFWKILVPTSTDKKQSLYVSNVINIAISILLLSEDRYSQVETLLFKTILQDHVWGALLATDIWCSILRKRPRLACETLCKAVAKTEPLLLDNFTNRPETVFLENFLRRLYNDLPDDYKRSVIETYPPSLLNLHVWKVLGFRNFPKAQVFMIESLLINMMEKIKGFGNGRCSVDDFNLLCAGFEAMSRLPNESDIDVKHLLLMVVNMWNFELDDGLKDDAFFKQFMPKLCRVTNNFILSLSNEQLLLILAKLKRLINAGFGVKIPTVQILSSLVTKSFAQSPQQSHIISALSELFRTLLLDQNPIVRQSTLEVFFHAFDAMPHEGIVQNAIRNEKQLQRIVTNFIQRNVSDKGTVGAEEYFALQKTYAFQHKCCEFTNEANLDVAQKKVKIDNEEIYLVVKRIKADVELLHRLYCKENASKQNVAEILSVLSRQINYKF